MSPLPKLAAAAAFSLLATAARADTFEVLVTEFMAVNDATLQDRHGEYSDWLEIYNNTAAPIDLAGWHLTDDAGTLTKWTFPTRNLDPGAFLVVFCSGTSDLGAELHANFKLSGDGEYLAIVKPDGTTISHAYAPGFPPQFADLSYGLDMALTDTELVGPGSAGKMHFPANGALGTTWTGAGFGDASWTNATNGVGYDTTGTLAPLIATDVEATMEGSFPGVYLRYPFTIAGAVDADRLVFASKYDDGFAAYLNGTLICDENIPALPVWNATALTGNVAGMSVADFTFPEPAYALINHSGDPAAIVGGSTQFTSQFLRLIHNGVNSNRNHMHFDRTDTGAFGTVTIDFDFRMNGTADGFSVLLLPTDTYGTHAATGSHPNAGEEPDIANTFAVGFDIFSNIDEVSLHFGNNRGANNRSSEIQLNSGAINHARIIVDPQPGGGSNVTVTVFPGSGGSPVVFFDEQFIADLDPYEFRLQFSGRTGGQTTDVDLDNITATQPGQPGLSQTFDGGGTGFQLENQSATPASVEAAEAAPSSDIFARLAYDGVTGTSNTLHFARANEGPFQRLTAAFDFRMDGAADGFGFYLLPTSIYGIGTSSAPANPAPAEEPNAANTFAVGFDIWNNIDEISLHYGSTVAETNRAGTINFSSNQWHRAHIGIDPDPGGGSRVSVSVTPDAQGNPGAPVEFHTNVSIPAFDPYEYRVQFSGRTGGATTTIDIDNIVLSRLAADGALEIEKPINEHIGLLTAGTNVLAFHGVNAAASDEDFLARPVLTSTRIDSVDMNTAFYYENATPTAPNVSGSNGPAGEVTLTPGGGFANSIAVTMAAATPGSTIRYTTDGSIPTESSTAYAGALNVTATTQFRARAFAPNFAPGPMASETYIRLALDLQSFTSDLPLVIVDNFGAGSVPNPGGVFQPAILSLHDVKLPSNRSSLLNAPDVISRAGIHKRGSSTLGQAKPNLRVETWGPGSDDDANIAPLGMPSESDWILYAPYHYDRALLRNAFVYQLSNDLGRYAVRTRFVEVFLNTGGGTLSYSDDYHGVYVLMETIKRDNDRVDIADLGPADLLPPDVTGGYLWKIDRAGPNETQFSRGGQGDQVLVDPDEFTIAPEQESYLKDHIDDFGDALDSASFTDPVLGYAPFLDVDSWIDHHLINVLAYNVDAFRLSTFLHKDREGVIVKGPVWDFDRSLESYDTRDDTAASWNASGGTDLFHYGWFDRLFDDPDFSQKWIDRWCSQRVSGGLLTDAHLFAILDGMEGELTEAAARNYAKWTGEPPNNGGSLAGEVQNIRSWLATRTAWIDSQFVAKPVHRLNGSEVAPGVYAASIGNTVGFTVPPGASVHYRTDGADPRGDGGTFAGTPYGGAFALTQSVSVPARGYDAGNTAPELDTRWGAPATATFLIGSVPASAPGLVISEVHYRPADATPAEIQAGYTNRDDFEFLELFNNGTQNIDLVDCRFGDGIEFTFPFSTELAPGQRLVLAKDVDAFELRYGQGINVIGGYGGRLSNDGENVQLLDWAGNVITEFTYNDVWYRITDGDGYSLELVDPNTAQAQLGDPASWGISCDFGGTPGYASTVFGFVYDLWAESHFTPAQLADSAISGALADIDNDGLVNLLEYAVNADPWNPASAPLPAASEIGGKLAATFVRRIKALDIDFVAEASTDLVTWTEITGLAGPPVDNGDGTETVTYLDTEDIATGVRRFIRLRVAAIP